jgi:hypothetical protein
MFKRKVKMNECKSFEGCTAPLCPLDKSFNLAVWYPGEPICGKRELPPDARRIIRVQRKISRRAVARDLSFDVTALSTIKRVHTSIKGRDSDTARKPRLLEGLIL